HVVENVSCTLTQDRELVVGSLHALRAELRRTCAHDRISLHRHDQILHSHLVEPAQAEAVAARESQLLLTALVDPDTVVCEDAVEVEDGKPDPLEERPEVSHERAALCVSAGGTSLFPRTPSPGRRSAPTSGFAAGSTSSNVTKSSAATGR